MIFEYSEIEQNDSYNDNQQHHQHRRPVEKTLRFDCVTIISYAELSHSRHPLPPTFCFHNAPIKSCEKRRPRFTANIKMQRTALHNVSGPGGHCDGAKGASRDQEPSDGCHSIGDSDSTLTVRISTSRDSLEILTSGRQTRESPSPAFNTATPKRRHDSNALQHARQPEMDESYVLSHRQSHCQILN